MNRFILIIILFGLFESINAQEKNKQNDESPSHQIIELGGEKYLLHPDNPKGEFKYDKVIEICNQTSTFGYYDWIIPTIDQFIEMRLKKVIPNNCKDIWYWSKDVVSDNTDAYNWLFNFKNGKQGFSHKAFKYHVFLIRKFN